MSNRAEVSYDESPDFFSGVASKATPLKDRGVLKNLVRDSYKFIIRYLSLLPPIDRALAKYYYVDGLSQEQIRDIFNISQSAVSRRLRYILNRINFLLRAPSLNPIQVREDLEFLFTEELFEFAYFYYFELAQNRVKFFVGASQSGVANKFKDILKLLESIVNEKESKFNKSDKDIMNLGKKKCLGLIYLDYFRFIHKKSNIINFLCKKNDEIRSRSLVSGDSIFK
jgi:predicted DNA-binding protein YlxM (UPF0122 family)